MHAPFKGAGYDIEPQEVDTEFLLAKISIPDIPFSRLPEKVTVQKEGNEEKFVFKVTSITGLSN